MSDEVVDQFPAFRQECHEKCPKQVDLYKACESRIAKSGVGDCEAWYIDLINCVDKCVAPKIFAVTKAG